MRLRDGRYVIIMERALDLKSEDLKSSSYLTLSSFVIVYKILNLSEPELSG